LKANYLHDFCKFAAETNFVSLPADVVQRTKEIIADTLAVVAAGSQESEIVNLVNRVARKNGSATLLGTGRKVETLTAALINGTAGTFLELDEGNQFARGHPAVHVVPGALALAEELGLSGSDLINAVALGYEIGSRIGIASKLRMSMHPHGTWGTVEAAVAAAKLRGLDAAQIREVINVSSTLGLGTSRKTMLEGATVRNVFSGVSNHLGLLAVDLVLSGFTGEDDGLSTIYGDVISTSFVPEEITADLGKRWEVTRNYFKLHACCRYNHSALDALEIISASFPDGRVPADQVAEIDVKTYSLAAQLNGQCPRSMLAAKFSIPFAAATYLVRGKTTVDCFRLDAVKDEATLALARKVKVSEDPQLTAMMPSRRPSRVTVKLTDGRTLTADTFVNRGDAEDPYGPQVLEAKYFGLAEPVWGKSATQAIWDEVKVLEKLDDVRHLTAHIKAV
jgi:2-methylcitrate dehydratase PrpD